MLVSLIQAKPSSKQALGATAADAHLFDLRKQIKSRDVQPGSLILLDFNGIEAINGSYIKASAFWIYLCGQLSIRNDVPDLVGIRSTDPKPYDIYCSVANLSSDVETEFLEFFGSRNLPFLVATDWNNKGVRAARLEGRIEPTLLKSLSCLLAMNKASAPEMHARYPEDKVTVTAWNNRLSDLHALRLVKRERSGRQWEYQPIIGDIEYGRSIH